MITKRVLAWILAVMLGVMGVITFVPFQGIRYEAKAASTVVKGTEGSMKWEFNPDNGKLSISGTGDMTDYTSSTGMPWSSYKTSIRTISIGSKITSVGAYAFYGCTKLTYVTLPLSVTSIHTYAFYGCSSMTEVKLPNRLSVIQSYAFYNNKQLISVSIPSSCRSIGDSAFYGCSKLKRVFYNGTNDQWGSIAIGSNNTPLTNATLNGNQSYINFTRILDQSLSSYQGGIGPEPYISISKVDLETVFFGYGRENMFVAIPSGHYISLGFDQLLPKGVASTVTIRTTGSDSAKGDVYAILEDDSEEKIGSFTETATEQRFEFSIESISGNLKGIKIKATNNAGAYPGVDIVNAGLYTNAVIPELTDDEYAVIVMNQDGHFLENASVTYNSHTVQTDSRGTAVFELQTVGQPVIQVTCDGYMDYSNVSTNYEKSRLHYEIIVLYDKTMGPLKLKSAIYQNTTFDHNMGIPSDILAGTKRLQTDKTEFSIICKAFDVSKVKQYQLWQNASKIAESTNGEFSNLKGSNFSDDGKVFCRVISTEGIKVDTVLNLIFEKTDAQDKNFSLEISDKIEFNVPSFIPCLGDQKLSFELPDIPVYAKVADDEIALGLNLDVAGDITTFKEWKEDVSNTIRQLKKLKSGDSLGKNLKEKVNSMVKNKSLEAGWGPVKSNMTVMGYATGKYDNDGFTEVSGEIALIGSISKTLQGPTTVVVVVPVTYSVKISGEAKLVFGFGMDLQTKTISGDLTFTVTPGVKPFGGAGIGKLTGAGVYGSLKLPIELQLLGTTHKFGVNSVTLSGSFGLKAYLGPWEYEQPLVSKDWSLYTRTRSLASSLQANGTVSGISGIQADSNKSWKADLYNEKSYKLSDLSYLKSESGWLGRTLASETSENGIGDFDVLVSDSYRNMQPHLGLSGDTPVMVWTRADLDERTEMNAAQLVYSVYDNGSWSDPLPVDSDNTFDSEASLYTDEDGHLWILYRNSNKEYTSESDLSEYAATGDLTAAVFDETEGFTGHTVISEEGLFNHMGVIRQVNGSTTAVWVSNSDNDWFSTNSTNRIMYSQYINHHWTAPQLICGNLNALTELDAGTLSDQGIVAAIIDTDNNLETTDDRQLIAYTLDGSSSEITNGSMSGLSLAKKPGSSAEALFFTADGSLYSYSGSDIETILQDASVTDQYQVLSDSIIVNMPEDDTEADINTEESLQTGGAGLSNLYAYQYDASSGTWNNCVKLTAQDAYIQTYDILEANGRKYLTAARADVTLTENAVEDKCSLCFTILEDLKKADILSAEVDEDTFIPEEDADLNLSLASVGGGTIETAQYTISDSDDVVIAEGLLENLELTGGSAKDVTVSFPVAETAGLNEYTITLSDPSGEWTEVTHTFKAGYSNLWFDTDFIRLGSSRKLMINYSNAGIVETGAIVNVYSGENVIYGTYIAPMKPGEGGIIWYDLPEELSDGEKKGLLRVEFTPDVEARNQASLSEEVYVNLNSEEAAEHTHYYADGICIYCGAGANGFFEQDGLWYYYKNGTALEGSALVKGTVNGRTTYWKVVDGQVSFTDGLASNANGTYYVKAGAVDFTYNGYAADDKGDYYIVKKGKVTAGPVSYIKSLTALTDGIKLSWAPVSGADSYRIFYKTEGGKWTRITNVSGTASEYTWTSAASGTTYYFAVRGLAADGTTYVSVLDSNNHSLAYVKAPVVTKAESAVTGIKITWGTVAGAEKYRIFYKVGSGKWTKVADVAAGSDTASSQSYTWTEAVSGTTYTFVVRALNAAGTSYTSALNTNGKSITYVAAPGVTKAENTATGVKVTWGTVKGAEKYRIFYKVDGGKWTKITDVTGSTAATQSYTWTGAVSGKTYTFVVRAVNAAGTTYTSALNTSGKTILYIKAPKVTSAVNTSAGIKISWGASAGAEKYRLFYKVGSGKWTKVADTTSTSYTWSGAVSGTTYTFVVRAVNDAGTAYTSALNTSGVTVTAQ